MKNEKTNILIFVLLKTGSSALVDLLREYDNLSVVPGEFDDYRAPGLIADQLTNHQNGFPNLIQSIFNFNGKLGLIYKVFPIFNPKEIINGGLPNRFLKAKLRLKRIKLMQDLNHQLLLTPGIEQKIDITKTWIKDIGDIYSTGKHSIVYNQPIEIVNEIKIWRKVFHPFKLIVVYRDPKDQLADIIKFGYLYGAYNGPYMTLSGVTLESIYGRNRDGAINFHIDAINKRFKWIDILKNKLDPEEFLLVDFEGLVNNYEKYKLVIENFLGVIKSGNEIHRSFFNPDNAKKSLGIYDEYLSEKDIRLLSESEKWYKFTKKNNVKIINKHAKPNEFE